MEDEESLRRLFAESLGDCYECVTASNAQEALDLLAGQEFALVISVQVSLIPHAHSD